MDRKELCALGIAAKKKLVELNKPQSWLISQVHDDTGLFIDAAYLCRIWTGDRRPPKIISSICKILEIEDPRTQSKADDTIHPRAG